MGYGPVELDAHDGDEAVAGLHVLCSQSRQMAMRLAELFCILTGSTAFEGSEHYFTQSGMPTSLRYSFDSQQGKLTLWTELDEEAAEPVEREA